MAEAVLLAVDDAATVALWVTGAGDGVKLGLGEASTLIAVSVMGTPAERLTVTAAAGVV